MPKLKQGINNLFFGDQKYSISKSQVTSKHQSLNALNRLNLSLGDVRDVFEPYLAIFARQRSPLESGASRFIKMPETKGVARRGVAAPESD